MGKCFLHGNGGANPLNFKVVGGTTAPANPKENTIWVNTDAEITSWIFSAAEPTGLVEGMVWISVGVSSSAEFNAMKKNGIQVYPLTAKQYVSGALVDKTAKSYQGGEWVEWFYGKLYYLGQECVPMLVSGSMANPGQKANYKEDRIVFSCPANGWLNYGTKEPIDLTDFKSATIDFIWKTPTNTSLSLRIVSAYGSGGGSGVIAKMDDNTSQFGYITVDLSGVSGKYYVIIAISSTSNASVDILKFMLS